MSITSFCFKGHKGSINSLDCSSSLLLSGSEDKTARVWDLRTSKTAVCIRAQAEVTSVAFFPHSGDEPDGIFAKNTSVFLSVDNAVLEYDLRQATTPILQQATRDLTENLQTTDEVNQLSVSSKKMLLAAADDCGSVKIWDGTRLRDLQPESTDPFLMTCCGFRSGDQLASGGTNCCVYLWDIGRPRKPLDSFLVTRDDAGANQVCNPPMVHSLSWSPSGRLLVAGLGDGSIQVLGVQKKKLVDLARLREGHDDSVASLCFPEFTGSNNNKADRLLASAGTDGAILFWDLKRSVGGDAAVDPRQLLSNDLLNEELEPNKDPALLFGIPHQHKVNWMVSSRTNALFVADTSNDITGYNVALQNS